VTAVAGTPVGREVELKLEVRPADLARLARHPRLLELAEGRPVRRTLRSVYFDTADLALWRSGLVLRVRADGRRRVVGVKTRGVVRGGLVMREERETPLAGGAEDPRRVATSSLFASIAEPRLRRAVERAAGGARLVPRVETRVRRSTLRLRLGTAAIELALDEGETRAGRQRLPIRELELELLSGPTRLLFDLALRLAADVELRPSSLGKAERGFARLLGEEAQPTRAEPVALEHDASVEAVLRTVFGECVRHLTANQLAAERGADPEGVHQMRVGARRLRSALRLFDEWLPAHTTQALSDELRWLGRELGRARDLDVFAGELLRPLAGSRPDDKGLAALLEAAEAARAGAYAAARAALSSRRYALLVLRLGRFAEGPPSRRGGLAALRAPALPAVRRLLRHRAARLQALGERLDQLSPHELHRLRIRAKRLRYAIELVGALFGEKDSTRAARRLAELQDALGHLNDLTSAEALVAQLRERIGAGASPATVRAEGFVLGYAARSAAAGRAELAHAWQRAARLPPLWKARR
jgi:triphosphatase